MCAALPLSQTRVWRQKVGFSPSFLCSSPRRYAEWTGRSSTSRSSCQSSWTRTLRQSISLSRCVTCCLCVSGTSRCLFHGPLLLHRVSLRLCPVFASHPPFFPSLRLVWTCPATSTSVLCTVQSTVGFERFVGGLTTDNTWEASFDWNDCASSSWRGHVDGKAPVTDEVNTSMVEACLFSMCTGAVFLSLIFGVGVTRLADHLAQTLRAQVFPPTIMGTLCWVSSWWLSCLSSPCCEQQ